MACHKSSNSFAKFLARPLELHVLLETKDMNFLEIGQCRDPLETIPHRVAFQRRCSSSNASVRKLCRRRNSDH